jgi:hypothetical protein
VFAPRVFFGLFLFWPIPTFFSRDESSLPSETQ